MTTKTVALKQLAKLTIVTLLATIATSAHSASYRIVGVTGQDAPGRTAVPFTGFDQPVINNTGRIAFWGNLPKIGDVYHHGIWKEGVSGLQSVAITGDQAPGVSANFYDLIGAHSPAFNDLGEVAFRAHLETGFPGWGIWREHDGSTQLVLRSGSNRLLTQAGPGFIVTTTRSITLGDPSYNDSGDLVFLGDQYVSGWKSSIMKKPDIGLLRNVAFEGETAPGTGGQVFTDFLYGSPVINNSADVVLAGDHSGTVSPGGWDPSAAIWTEKSGALQLVVKRGDVAPGTGGATFVSFFPTGFNSNGDTIFTATLDGPGVDGTNDSGTWKTVDGNLQLAARKGQVAPGTGGAVFSNAGGTMNNRGQIAINGIIEGPGVDESNNTGIWTEDTNGNLQIVVREGQALQVAPGDFRTIAGKVFVYGDQSFVSQPFLFGKKGFNDAGQITFRADFGDDSSAVVVASSANGLATRLTTGSPVELAQDIPVPDWPATLVFDYQFQSNRGTLSVLLGDETLAQLTADDGPVGHFERTIDLSGLGLSGDTVLKLVFDDTTSGSVLVIDNIDFPGLENGDFEQGLLYFTTTGEGTASLVDVGEATRETLASTCPCDNDSGANWKNRGKYISCVGKISDSMVLLGLLGETEQDELVSEASHSSCGR